MQTEPLAPDPAAQAADPPRAPTQRYVLKQGDTFLVADPTGNVTGGDDGLFHNDTRILSRFCLEIGGRAPWVLGAAVSQDNVFFTATLTNFPLPPLGGTATPEGVIQIERKRLLLENRIYERLSFTNFSTAAATLPVSIAVAADYRDMFEVRGQQRRAHGTVFAPHAGPRDITLHYEGLDAVCRTTVIAFAAEPATDVPPVITASGASFQIEIPRGRTVALYSEVGLEAAPAPSRARFRAAAAQALMLARRIRLRGARLRTPSRLFNEWIDRSQSDLALLTTELPTGPYPYAGIPWFSTPFGRDAIITCLQTLWLNPALARGVLNFLARNQAHETSHFRDSAPGKIMHETRKGEMAVLEELPFGQYYGGVDTTPLFVMLAGEYAARTGDMAFIRELWPALRAAMAWIEDPANCDEHGFLTYERGADTGLANQGWKDSQDSISHEDGSLAVGRIGLVEVQGYVYAALRHMSVLAATFGDTEEADAWTARADRLRHAVETHFWMADQGFYGLALDGEQRLCRVRASNAGHLLFCGLPAPDRAARVAEQLMSPALRTGWGVRTLAQGAARFNPMSYHNGSVWPHDTALCAAGIAQYGHRDEAVGLLANLFESAVQFNMRLPELFCGFPRAAGEPPIPYPVACLPQAWAAGSIFMVLQACLGLRIDGARAEIHVDRPHLPQDVDRISIHRILVGQEYVDLTFERMGSRVVAFADGPGRHAVAIKARM
jgi:glycogen debranching enzyme